MRSFISSFMEAVEEGLAFDPDGDGYDYATAKMAGLSPNEEGHWPSRVPSGPLKGLILKGRRHETWHKTVERDKRLGYGITKDPNTKRYFSREDPDLIKAPHPSRLQMLKGKLEEDK